MKLTNNSVQPYSDNQSFIEVDNAVNGAITNNRAGQYRFSNDGGSLISGNTIMTPVAKPAATASLAQAMSALSRDQAPGSAPTPPVSPVLAVSSLASPFA